MRDLLKIVAAQVISDPFESLFVVGMVVIGSAFIVRAAIVILTGSA